MSGGFDDGGDRDLDAAEYVLGTLSSDERAAFADHLKRDAAAARSVAGWEARLAGLAGRFAPVEPPSYIWQRVERTIGGSASVATMHPFKVIPGGGQGPDVAALRRSRNKWRIGTLLSGAVAAALLVALADQIRRETPTVDTGATYIAAVNRGGAKPALIVRVDLKTGQVMVRPVAATAPAGHSLELWYIGADKTPRSMGLVDKIGTGDKESRLPGAPTTAATFAISIEPPGGSKTGGPTGPVEYLGQLVKE